LKRHPFVYKLAFILPSHLPWRVIVIYGAFHYFLVDQVQEQTLGNTQTAAKKRKAPPKCSLCGHPTKGHSKVTTCPKNQRKQ